VLENTLRGVPDYQMDKIALDQVLGTVHALLEAEELVEAAIVVRTYQARAEQTGYDNWNGGTGLWTVYFDVPPREYARFGSRREQVEGQITARLKAILEPDSGDWYSAAIVPSRNVPKDWRAASSNVPRDVRRNILDGMRLEGVLWRGELDDVEFLSRLYDLKQLPSHDNRFKDAAGDIWQHTVNNDDWEPDWVFGDDRFALLNGSADSFLRFLCEVVHPVVRPDRDAAIRLVSHFNDQLRGAGWEIVEEERIGGRPRFSFGCVSHQGGRAVSRARTVADALDSGWMAKEIERLERAAEADPALAIGTAKELVESCCKSILTKLSVPYARAADLGELTKLLVKALKLVPEGIPDGVKGAENIRLILRNLTAITNNLAQLRGLYGTGHGRDGQHRGLQPRHARLAVASAVAFVDFVAETYRNRDLNADLTTKP
jgi:hypothetical protein